MYTSCLKTTINNSSHSLHNQKVMANAVVCTHPPTFHLHQSRVSCSAAWSVHFIRETFNKNFVAYQNGKENIQQWCCMKRKCSMFYSKCVCLRLSVRIQIRNAREEKCSLCNINAYIHLWCMWGPVMCIKCPLSAIER